MSTNNGMKSSGNRRSEVSSELRPFKTLNRLFTAGMLVAALIACQGMSEPENSSAQQLKDSSNTLISLLSDRFRQK